MKLLELFEARSNPEINTRPPGFGHELAVDYMSKIPVFDRSQYCVTMTNIPKVGINPGSKYDTPLGIYAYPANMYIAVKKGGVGRLPFQDEAPYINILKIDGEILLIDALSEQEYKTLLNNLQELPCLDALEVNDIIDEASQEASTEAKVKSAGGYLWYVMWKVAGYYQDIEGRRRRNNSTADPDKVAKPGPILWNKMLRELGFAAISDRGDGIIHESEPSQVVIVDPTKVSLVKRFDNVLPQLAKAQRTTRSILRKIVENRGSTESLVELVRTKLDFSIASQPENKALAARAGDILADRILQDPDNLCMYSVTSIHRVAMLAGSKEKEVELKSAYWLNRWTLLGTKHVSEIRRLLPSVSSTPPLKRRSIMAGVRDNMEKIKDFMGEMSLLKDYNKDINDIYNSITELFKEIATAERSPAPTGG